MKRSSKILRITVAAAVAIGAGVGIGLYARAAMNVPVGFAYSGLLRDSSGNPVTGTHNFAFDLLNGAGASAGCATDTRSSLTVTNGRFDVPDLFKTCATLDTVLATQSGLAIKISVDGTALVPAQPLGTVPFSARARLAEGIDGVLPIANGGTGSATQNFVDVSTDQVIAGNKTFTGSVVVPSAYAQFEGATQTFAANAWTGVNFSAQPVANNISVTTNSITFMLPGTYKISLSFRPDNGISGGSCGDIWTAARLYGNSLDVGHSVGTGSIAPNALSLDFLATVSDVSVPYQLQIGRLAGACPVATPPAIAGDTPPAVQATLTRLGP
jgi:hypothetical protein